MKTHSQCLYFALDRWAEEGGYLMLGKSTHWLIPHVLHLSNEKRLTHFIPPADLDAPWHSLFGFYGSVIVDDQTRREPMTKTGILLGTVILLTLGGWWAVKRTVAEWVRPIP